MNSAFGIPLGFFSGANTVEGAMDAVGTNESTSDGLRFARSALRSPDLPSTSCIKRSLLLGVPFDTRSRWCECRD